MMEEGGGGAEGQDGGVNMEVCAIYAHLIIALEGVNIVNNLGALETCIV